MLEPGRFAVSFMTARDSWVLHLPLPHAVEQFGKRFEI